MSSSNRYSAAPYPRCSRKCCAFGGLLLGGFFSSAFGCSSLNFGGGRLVKELEAENDRLLAEFRAERDRRENIEKALRRTEQRLAESEKQLAQQVSIGASRLSQLPSSPLGGSNYTSNAYSNPPPFSSEVTGKTDASDASTGSLRWMRRRP